MNELLNILLSSRDRMATGQTERLRFMNALLAFIFNEDQPEGPLFEEFLEAINNLPGIDFKIKAAWFLLLDEEGPDDRLIEIRRLIDATPNSYGTGTFWKLFNQTFITLVVGGGGGGNQFDALGEFISEELLCQYYNDNGFIPNITVYNEGVEGEEGVEYFFYTDEDFENPVAPGFYIINFYGDFTVVEIDINGKGLSYKDVNQLCNEPTGFQAFEYELTYCADYPNYAAYGYEELSIYFTIIGEQTKWFNTETGLGLPNGKYILVDDDDYYILEVDEDSYEFSKTLIEDCPPLIPPSPPSFTAYVNENPMYGGTWFDTETLCDDWNGLSYSTITIYIDQYPDGIYYTDEELTILLSTTLGGFLVVDFGGEVGLRVIELDNNSIAINDLGDPDTLCAPPGTYESWVSGLTYCADYPNYNDLEYQSLRTYSEAGEDGMYWFEQTEGIGITLSIGEYIVKINANDYYLLEVDSDGKELAFDEIVNCPPEEEV